MNKIIEDEVRHNGFLVEQSHFEWIVHVKPLYNSLLVEQSFGIVHTNE